MIFASLREQKEFVTYVGLTCASCKDATNDEKQPWKHDCVKSFELKRLMIMRNENSENMKLNPS